MALCVIICYPRSLDEPSLRQYIVIGQEILVPRALDLDIHEIRIACDNLEKLVILFL